MHWLVLSNNLNKLKARLFPNKPISGYIYGIKFQFRGRFSRKQRAGSFVTQIGDMPLILYQLLLIMVF